MESPTLLVLAAGMGSRYGGLKQIDPMGPNGETMLDFSVFDALRAGFNKVVFVIRRDFEHAFRNAVGAKFSGQIEVAYAFQDLHDLPSGFTVPDGRTKPWGTAHAIRAARDLISTPFAAINADDFYGRESYQQIAHHFSAPSHNENGHPNPDHYCMVGYQIENTLSDHGHVSRGICSVESGFLQSVEEHTGIARSPAGAVLGTSSAGHHDEIPDGTPVSMNFWGFSPSAFKHIESHFSLFLEKHGSDPKAECYIPSVVDSLIRSGSADCRVLPTSSPWFGVTYPDDKPIVIETIRRLMASGDYPPVLFP